MEPVILAYIIQCDFALAFLVCATVMVVLSQRQRLYTERKVVEIPLEGL